VASEGQSAPYSPTPSLTQKIKKKKKKKIIIISFWAGRENLNSICVKEFFLKSI
jgi:hypothetical protein